MKNEPRFLLEEDSICYGCEWYRHINECYEPYTIPDDNIDENGETCDCYCPCFDGNMDNNEAKNN